MSNQDDFDVVKHGYVHPESYTRGYRQAIHDISEIVTEYLKNLETKIKGINK